jgi:hypothetical protein
VVLLTPPRAAKTEIMCAMLIIHSVCEIEVWIIGGYGRGESTQPRRAIVPIDRRRVGIKGSIGVVGEPANVVKESTVELVDKVRVKCVVDTQRGCVIVKGCTSGGIAEV